MLQPKPKFTPPSDAVVVESESSFVPPSDAIEIKKKEPTESTFTTPAKNLESVQRVGSSDGVGSNGFPSIDVNLGVPGLKPNLKTVEQLANPPKSNTDSTKPIKKFEGLIPDKTKGFYRQGEENVEDKKYIDEGFSNKTEYVTEDGKLVPKTKTTYVSEATKNLKADYAKEIGRKSISEYDPNLTEENLQKEKEQSGVLNTLGKVGKYILNATGESFSAWNEAFGGDKDYFTIDQYKPLQDQKTQAKSELQREGLPVTEEAVQKRAEDIFRKEDRIQQIQKRVDANLPEDYDREGIWKELKLDNLKNNDKLRSAVATIDINKKQIDDFNKYAAYVNSLPKEKITQDKVDKYNKLLAEAQDSSESLEYYQKTFPKLLKEVKSSDELLDVMKFNYNDYEKAYSNITGLGKTIAMGTLKLAGETANYTDQILGREGQDTGYRQAIIDVANEELDKNTKDKEQYIRYKAKDINSFSDGGSFMAQLGTEQLPVYATLVLAPEIGLPLLGSGTAGEQFRNMEVEEMHPFAKQTTFGQKLATAYLYGSAETLFERLGTVSVLKNIEKSIARASNASRKLIYEGAAKESTKLAKRLGLNTAIEGGTEYLTAEAQIGADKYVSGKNISSQQANERRFESTVAGGLMGGSMTLMGGVWGSIAQKAKLYSENKDIKETKAILSQIDLLSDELKNNPNLNAEDKKIIYDKMNDLTNKSFDIVIKNSEKGKNFSAKENQFLVDINVKQDQLKQKFEELKNSNISTEQKELLVKDLKNQYAQLEKDRNSTLKGEFETIPDIRKIITFQKKEEENLIKEEDAKVEIPIAETEVETEVQEQTNEQKVAQLRADEQAELKAALPNAELNAKGKIDFQKLSLTDSVVFDDIYNKYDKLITPLLEAESKKPSEKQEKSSEQKITDIEKEIEDYKENSYKKDAEREVYGYGNERDENQIKRSFFIDNDGVLYKRFDFGAGGIVFIEENRSKEYDDRKRINERDIKSSKDMMALTNKEALPLVLEDIRKTEVRNPNYFSNTLKDKYDELEALKATPTSTKSGDVAENIDKKQPTNAKEWEEQNFSKEEIDERRKFGLTPEQEWEPTFRGTTLSEWEKIQNGDDFKSEGLNELVFTTPSKELAKQSGKGVDAEVIIEFKPESKSKMREGDAKYDSKEYYGNGLNKEDVLRVTDKNGNVIYEATSTENGDVVAKKPTIIVHGAVNGFGLQYSEGIDEKDIVAPKDARGFLPQEDQVSLNKGNSVIQEDSVLENGDKKISIITPATDNFGRSAANTFEFVIPTNNTSTTKGIQSILDNVRNGDLKGKELIDETVKQVKEYINSNELTQKKAAPVAEKAIETTEDSTADKFQKSLTLLKEIDSKQGVDARNAKRERNEFLKDNPTIKYIDDNYKNIVKQLEKQGLFKQLKDC